MKEQGTPVQHARVFIYVRPPGTDLNQDCGLTVLYNYNLAGNCTSDVIELRDIRPIYVGTCG